MSHEQEWIVAKEKIVLNKYDGDLTEEEMLTAVPVETITIVDGEIIDVVRRDDNATN